MSKLKNRIYEIHSTIITQVATYKILNKKTMFFLKNKGFSLILDVFCSKSGLETPPTREFTKSVATWVIIVKSKITLQFFIGLMCL